jgi:hypothetical protein
MAEVPRLNSLKSFEIPDLTAIFYVNMSTIRVLKMGRSSDSRSWELWSSDGGSPSGDQGIVRSRRKSLTP